MQLADLGAIVVEDLLACSNGHWGLKPHPLRTTPNPPQVNPQGHIDSRYSLILQRIEAYRFVRNDGVSVAAAAYCFTGRGCERPLA